MNDELPGQPVNILMVEDNPDDVRVTMGALQNAKIRNSFRVVENGADALTFLRRMGPFSDAPRPDLILLDLDMPNQDGREVLEQIKRDPKFSIIPVVILTESGDEQAILHAYRSHANCCITKPIDFEQFIQVVRLIEDFWFSVVKLPPK